MSIVQTEQLADRIRVGHEDIAIRVSSSETDGRFLAMEVRMPAGGGPPALHRHDPAEVYRVLEGEFTVYIGAGDAVERFVAPTGAIFHFEGGLEHTIRNESDCSARAYVTFINGTSRMEEFFRAAAAQGHGARPEDILAAAAQHGITITRPIPGQP